MQGIFIDIVNMSILGSWLILAIILFRLCFKKTPKWIVCMLWCFVGIRLICPFSIESRFSLVPKEKAITVVEDNSSLELNSYRVSDGLNDNDLIKNTQAADQVFSDDNQSIYIMSAKVKQKNLPNMNVVLGIWIIGVVAIGGYSIIAYVRLKYLLRDAVRYQDRIYQTERITSPFILGLLNPYIYIPYGLSNEQMECVIAHEYSHMKRLDHVVKPLGYILLAIYWFNPLMWISYILFCHDIELACDEKVIKLLGYDKKQLYSQTILEFSIPKKMIMACPVAFAEIGVKERVIKILKLKKTKKSVLLISLLTCIAITVTFMTTPLSASANKNESNYENVNVALDEMTIDETTTEKMAILEEMSEDETIETINELAATEDVKNENAVNIAETTYTSDTEKLEQIAIETNGEQQAKDDGKISLPTPIEGYESYEYFDSTWSWPILSDGVITRAYDENHKAIDIAAPEGTDIVGVLSGVVQESGYDSERGNYVVVKSNTGITVTYEHCYMIWKSEGEMIYAGETFGKVGSTGRSTGPHLHIEFTDADGNAIDFFNIYKQ